MDICNIGGLWLTPSIGISGITAGSSHLSFARIFILFCQFYHFPPIKINNIYNRMYYMMFEIRSRQPLNQCLPFFGCLDNTIITQIIWCFRIINTFVTFSNFGCFLLVLFIIICNFFIFFGETIFTCMWHIIFSG